MTPTPHADALLAGLIVGPGYVRFKAFADLTNGPNREKALRVLLAMLSDPDPSVCYRAVRALSALGDKRAVEPLRNSLEAITSTDVFEATAEALVSLNDLDAIMPLLYHRRSNIGLYTRLMKFNTEDLLRVLGDALSHPDKHTRRIVLLCLRAMKCPEAVPLFVRALEDESSDIRSLAAENLKGIVEVVPVLLPHLLDHDPQVRGYVAQTLGETGDPRAIAVLLPLLEDANEHVRMRAALALGKLGDATGVALIRAYVASCNQTSSFGYLEDALKVLRTLGEMLVPLLIALNERLPMHIYLGYGTRFLIAGIFANVGDPAALPLLEKMLESDDERLRLVAKQVIKRTKAQTGGQDQ